MKDGGKRTEIDSDRAIVNFVSHFDYEVFGGFDLRGIEECPNLVGEEVEKLGIRN